MSNDRMQAFRWAGLTVLFWMAVCGLSRGPLYALTVNGREVPLMASVGAGARVSYLLVDFGGATPPGNSYLFAYYYDNLGPAKTGLDLIQELTANTDLNSDLQDFGFGAFVRMLEVEGVVGDTPNFATDGRYWEYWLGSSQDGIVQWSSAPIGISDRLLTDGSVDGWYASTGGVRPLFPGADLNGDARVDGADAGIAYRDWGGASSSVANLNLDATVDNADLGRIFSHWTGDATTGPASVPEPILSLATLAIPLLSVRRR